MSERAFGAERNDALRKIVREIKARDFADNLTATARALGVKPPSLYDFLDGQRGAGMKLLDGIVRYTGRSIDELLGRVRSGHRWGNLPGWAAAAVEAKRTFQNVVPPWAIDAVGEFTGEGAPRAVTAWAIGTLAQGWFAGASAAQRAETQARLEPGSELPTPEEPATHEKGDGTFKSPSTATGTR